MTASGAQHRSTGARHGLQVLVTSGRGKEEEEMKRPQVVDCEARRHDINGGHMRKQALALLHTWTWVTSRTYAESHRQAAIGDRAGPRVMQSCSCVRSRTRGGINKRTVCPPPFCFDLPRRRRADATGGRRCSDPILAVPRPTERQRCCERP